MASWYGSLPAFLQLASEGESARLAVPPRLMFATKTSLFGSAPVRVEVTHSLPQMMSDREPEPWLLSTSTAYSVVSGATPTTPFASFFAATVPATWLPWPWSSFELLRELSLQIFLPALSVFAAMAFVPCLALRSGWVRSMPVSMTAMFAPLP